MSTKEARRGSGEFEIDSARQDSFKPLTDELLRDHFRFGEGEVSLKVEGNSNAVAILNKLRGTVFAQYLLTGGALFREDATPRSGAHYGGKMHWETTSQPTVKDENLVEVLLTSHHENPHTYSGDQPQYFWFRHLGITFVYGEEGMFNQGTQTITMFRRSEDVETSIMPPSSIEITHSLKTHTDDGGLIAESFSTQEKIVDDEQKEQDFLSFASDVIDYMKHQQSPTTSSQ